jgi:uncharacterized protein (TIGR03118 family)
VFIPTAYCSAVSWLSSGITAKTERAWGMALAPSGFGNRLLVGNLGNCRMNVFDMAAGEFIGQLESTDNVPVRIEGLCGFAFGNGFLTRPVNTLLFTAGPGDERHGVYGRLDVQSHDNLYRK